MKIAIVAPSPVPFTIGGIENFVWEMCDWMNQNTEHQVELLKFPSRESNFWDLIATYEYFYRLDLSHFDLIISVKYPAWMIPHKNHICYMAHRLRGLYDTYHFTKLPLEVKRGNYYIDSILQYMESHIEPENLNELFLRLWNLKKHETEIPQMYFDFPGAFIRRIIHYLDDFALSPEHMASFFCISNTVRKRTDYFPTGVPVTVAYPPSKLKQYNFGEYKHIFMISRLDGPKRIDLLIQAMAYVKSNIKLYIAGTGPQEAALKVLAQNDARIKFLGYINDETAEEYYKDALVIPYFPYDEDYGYITIEAMMRGKPVITTTDAGGPTEFVVNNETGFVLPASPKRIAEKIDYLAGHPEEAKRLGKKAFQKVSDITWRHVVETILDDTAEIITKKQTESACKVIGIKDIPAIHQKRKTITVTSTFPIYPPQGGGQARTYNLYKHVAREYEVEIISFTNHNQKPFCGQIADGLTEIRIPKTQRHQEMEWELEKGMGISVADIALISLSGETPEYGEKLRTSISKSDFIILSHPYLYKEVREYVKGKKLIYEAQDVEFAIKKGMLPGTRQAKHLLEQLFEVEKACCQDSSFVMTCSDEDQKSLHEIYGISFDRMVTIPNGVDISATRYTPLDKRLLNKRNCGLDSECLGLFMGSWHRPNLEACEVIFRVARECPNVKFLLMGSQCAYFKQQGIKIPDNVGLLGVVDETTKNRIFSVVDFALNPMASGSGTNLKMFDYMAAGIPIISTKFGTRGIDRKDIFIVEENSNVHNFINHYKLSSYEQIITNSYQYVTEYFDWSKIAQGVLQRLSDIG